jgi:hypothetical protein
MKTKTLDFKKISQEMKKISGEIRIKTPGLKPSLGR